MSRETSARAAITPRVSVNSTRHYGAPMSSIEQPQVTFDCAEPVGIGLVGEERLATLEAECARLVALGAVRVRLLTAVATTSRAS
jgi:hypothetical protein